MDFKTLIYQPGRVARVILNRPEKLNSIDPGMRAELANAWARLITPACRASTFSRVMPP